MKEVHLICNAHIDPIWQWNWQEGASAAVATFASALRLLETHDYIFCHSEVTAYRYVETYAPELFEKIRRRVKEGRWKIVGGWFLQPDCNMPCGESMVRQILYGKKYFTEKFGVFPEIAFNVDAFGHSCGLVQIIRKCGQKGNIVCRPYAGELPLAHSRFTWEGPDGSSIAVMRATDGYNTLLGKSLQTILERAEKQPESRVAVLWGVGNHGGGPSDKDLTDIENHDEKTDGYRLIHSDPETFFGNLRPEGKENRSLRIAMPGCYTSLGKLKREHVKLENELYLTEEICSLAEMNGLMGYPSEKTDEINEDLMTAEFHDVLPGSCVKAGEENGLRVLLHGQWDAEKLKTKAYFALCNELPAAEKGEYPIVVFNSRPYGYTENTECEFMLADQNWSEENITRLSVFDEEGRPVRFQTVKEESNVNLDWRKKIVFEAQLKPCSVNRFRVFAEYKKADRKAIPQDLVFDNGYKYVRIGRETGLLESYRIGGKEYVRNAFLPVMFEDNADPWAMSAFQQERLGTNGEPFLLSEKPGGVFEGMKSVRAVEDGEIYLGVEAFFEKRETRVRVFYKIYKNNPHVDVEVNVFMGNRDRFVKLKIPVSEEAKGETELIGQTMFGAEPLFTDGRENVSQRYLAAGKPGGEYLEIINDCIYGSHYENGAVYLSLVRGVTYCSHPILDRKLIPDDRFTRKPDQGESDFSFRLTVAKENELERRAKEFNFKPYAVSVFPLGRKCGKGKNTEISVSDPNITLEALRKKSDGNGYVIRLFNGSRTGAETVLKAGGHEIALRFSAYEVKTILLEKDGLSESEEMKI